MKFEEVMVVAGKVGEYFQRLPTLDKAVVGAVIVSITLAVLSRTGVLFVFAVAVYLGGWAATRVAGHVQVLSSRLFLPFVPNFVDHCKEKRRQAGLSVLPNFEANLYRYSVQNMKMTLDLNVEAEGSLSVTLPDTVDEEFQHLIKSIMHDFVLSWYTVYVSDHSQVSEELLQILLSASENLCFRLQSINKRNLLLNFLVEFRTHIFQFQRARSSLRKLLFGRTIDSKSLVASYETFLLMHPAIEDTSTEMNYLKGVMRVLLHSALPKRVTQCHASSAVLVEILTCNLLIPLLDLLADPDFLYRIIMLIVSGVVNAPDKTGTSESMHVSTDNSKPKIITSQRSACPPENVSIAPVSRPPFDGVRDSALSEGADNCDSPSATTCTYMYDIFEPRSSLVSDLPSTCNKIPSPLNSKEPVLLPASNEAATAQVSISQSIDASIAHTSSAMSQGSQSSEDVLTHSQAVAPRHHRSASDSSFNPAQATVFIGEPAPVKQSFSFSLPRDVSCTVVSSVNQCIPRPLAEGAEKTSTPIVVPLTALEPAIPASQLAVTPLSKTDSVDSRPRSLSADSFSSVDYDTSQMNVQFSDIDNQFAFEDSPRDVSTATSVINSGFLTDLQIKQSNSANDINGEFTQNRETQERRSGPSKAVPFSDGVGLESTCTQTSVSATYAEIPDFSQPQDKETSRPQLTSLGVNAAGSSPIKKLLKRVSFSKKKHPKPQCEIASSGSPQVSTGSQSAPVSLPISIQTPGSSAINQKISHPTSSTISINSDMQLLVVTPAAEDPKTTGTCISVSAPEMFSASASRFLEGTPSLKITNLTIPEAEVCKEFGGKGEFFLYSIQFDVVPTITPSSSTENIQRCDLGPVHKITKRRHREFVNLHSRLEHNFQLKPSLKGIHDVPKRLSIPLAPTAKPAIDQRRISHQHYLQQLLARPLLHCSRELAEFLALEGNTHIEYVRHHPREYVPRIDKMLRNRVSGLVESIKHARSAIPRALSDIGPLPPMSPPMSPVRKSRGSHLETDKKMLSPPTSQRPGSPSPIDEQDGSGGDRIFVFDRRPKTTVQLATCSIIQDHSMKTCANVTSPAYRPAATTPINHHSLGPRSNGDGYESPEMAPAETPSDERESITVLGSEKVALLDSVLCFLGDIFHDKDLWFLDEGFQSVLTILAGDLLDGWIERQVNLLLSDQWCAFYMAELREALWPGGKLLSANEGTGTRTEAEKAATMKEVLTMLVDAMPDLFYTVVDKQDWQDGLQLLLDSLGDPQLNRHLLFTILDLMMDALISEIKDEDFQKNLFSRI